MKLPFIEFGLVYLYIEKIIWIEMCPYCPCIGVWFGKEAVRKR